LITGSGVVEISRHKYYPFGREITSSTQDAERLKFTGHERDEENLDYMHARYYLPYAGRFLSVDPVLDSVDPSRPQSWNRYAYVLNNPLGNTDPTGKVPCTVSDPAVNDGAPFESDCSTVTPDGEDITDQEAQEAQARVANAAAAQNMGQYYARRTFEGLVPQGTLLLGFSGSGVFPIGGEGSIGIAVNTDVDSESRVDGFVYAGGGVGLDVGVSVVGGWVPGEFSRVPGMATNITGSVLLAARRSCIPTKETGSEISFQSAPR
jgi:RHS repeat-associated protein